ncbi:MAG TPA: radical SAM protein [Desulfuromonadales bacterium]|jgi:radical SAM protein with 4Fe4S-binding SPASM domain
MTPFETANILKREGLRPPKTLTLAITGVCNLTCRHCWVEAGGADSATHVPERTLCRLIEEFAELGGEGVRLTGGEPLCHPGWLGLLRFARDLGLRSVSLQTNGMLFREEEVAALRELDFPGLTIQISLDGATASTHDLVRGDGAFQGVLDGLRRLVRGGLAPRLTLFFTEMRHNLEDIPAVFELAADLGICSVVTGTLVLGGRAAEGSLVSAPTPEQYLHLLRRYDSEPRFRELYEKIGKMAVLEWRAAETPRTECCTFVENPYLTPTGQLYPCLLCHTAAFSVSGVFEKSLADSLAEGAPLWASLMQISRSRADDLAECRECPGRRLCAGGCMGRAWGSCGDLRAADDRCETRRTIYHRKQSLPT